MSAAVPTSLPSLPLPRRVSASDAVAPLPHPAAGSPPERGLGRELAEVTLVLGAVSAAGWYSGLSYYALGHLYLLTVIVLSLRVSRGPALVAAVVSALAWDHVFIPPRLEFSLLSFDESLLLGTYFVAALTAGQLTNRIREQQRTEQRRKERATALFHLTRALAGAHTLDEGVSQALAQADRLFDARTALLLVRENGALAAHPTGRLPLDPAGTALANAAAQTRQETGRFVPGAPPAPVHCIPLLREDVVLGVLVIQPASFAARPSNQQRELLEAFAAQIALLVEREQLRSAREQARLLAESDRLHRTLLDSVSHELRTPLAVLRAAAEALGRNDAGRRPDLPGEILTATHRLNQVVGNLLSQSRLESGVEPRSDWCDARDLVAAARRELGESLAGRPLRLAIPADLPLLFADAPLLEHVLANLLLNAALYSPPGSPITVTARLDCSAHRIQVTVADEGPGIPPELRDVLFQKFRRGPTATGKGLGLGLSIVRGLMQAHGGDVVIEDHAGPGARVTLDLPHRQHACVPQE